MTAPREYKRDPKGSSTGGQFTIQAKSAQSAPKKKAAKSAAPEPVSKPSSARFKTLAPGEDNDAATVKEMQQLLTALGMGNLKVDGDYGANTTAAVKAAQRRLGLKPTGKASKALVNKLLNAYDLSPCIKRSEDPDGDEIERGVPHPGQRYRHNWIPTTGLAVLGPDFAVDELNQAYGDTIDNEQFAPGAWVEIGEGSDTIHIDVAGEQQGRFHVFADMEREDAQNLATDIDWAWDRAYDLTNNLSEPGHRPPDSVNGLQDWRLSGDFLVGYTPDGQTIRVGSGVSDGGDVVSMDLTTDQARALQEALARLADTDTEGDEE